MHSRQIQRQAALVEPVVIIWCIRRWEEGSGQGELSPQNSHVVPGDMQDEGMRNQGLVPANRTSRGKSRASGQVIGVKDSRIRLCLATNYVTLKKLLYRFEIQFSEIQKWVISIPTH